jgi:hypothetical protein
MVSLPVAVVGDGAKCPTCKAASGENKSDAKPYEEFFDASEKADFDAIAAANPDLAVMLPPKTGFFKVRSKPSRDSARKKFEKAKKEAGQNGDIHHPHPIKLGGCPIHQQLVEKPDVEPEKSRVQAVDDQINDIVNRAIARG